jgi:hypothetical protein
MIIHLLTGVGGCRLLKRFGKVEGVFYYYLFFVFGQFFDYFYQLSNFWVYNYGEDNRKLLKELMDYYIAHAFDTLENND